MSVYLCEEGSSVEDCLLGRLDDGVAALRVGDLRALGFGIVRAPEGGPHHAEVTGRKGTKARRRILKVATVKFMPTDPERAI
jgi:hypothetical protein